MLPHTDEDPAFVFTRRYQPFCKKHPAGYEVLWKPPAPASAEGHIALRAAVHPALSMMGVRPCDAQVPELITVYSSPADEGSGLGVGT
jgi:hypothetical protein